jgi:hypothetical protein
MMQHSPQLPTLARTPRLKQRDLALGLGSLLVHVLLLVLLPGLAVPKAQPAPLLIHLIQPDKPEPAEVTPPEPASKPLLGLDTEVPGGMGARSLEPQDGQAAVRRSSPGSNPHPKKPAGAAGLPVPTSAPAQAPDVAQPAPASEAAPTSEGDTTEVVRPPRVVKQSPKEQSAPAVPPTPDPKPGAKAKPKRQAANNTAAKSAQAGTAKAKQPKAQPQGRPEETGAPGVAKPAPETGKPDPTPNSGTGSGPSPNPGNGSGNTPGAPDNTGPEGRTAPDFGAPALPKGPGDGELAILGRYGDHCMEEIKKMARNPEQAREKFKGQAGEWGTVTFQFEVTKSGKLLDVRVLNNGGFAPLGEEVEEAVRVCGRTGKFGSWSKYGSVPMVDSWTFKRRLKFPLY